MIISFLFFSAPILFAVADALLPTALLSAYVSSPVPDPSPAYSFIQPLNSHLTSYDFRYSLIDIPLISIIRSAIILCVYGLCDGPGLSRGPYLGITTVCSVVTLLFVSVKAAYVFGGSNSGFTAAKVALFVCSMSLAVGHIVVAYRTSCRERRKLLVFKIDIEAQKKQINKREINIGGQVYMAEEFQSEVCNGSWRSSTRATFNSSSFMANYGVCWQNDFQTNMIEFNSVSSMPGFSSLEKPKQQVLGGLHLANKTLFWNTSALDLNDNRAAFFASTQSQYLPSTYGEKPNCPNIKSQSEEIRDLESSLKKGSSEPTFKRPSLETPSPLPTFKVRKEKLGNRVTALQQLVSPFGKTDTASVLHEAIEYIKLLHDQVNVLSTPYMKNGTTMQRQEIHDKVKDNTKGAKQQDLRGRGLCLVPVSSTFPVTNETTLDYWTSSFGGTFR